MMNTSDHQHIDVLFFSKAPRPGEVKTRLAKDIGDHQAAALHASFIKVLAGTLERFALAAPLHTHRHIVLARADTRHHPLFDEDLLGGERAVPWRTYIQQGKTLGERLTLACQQLPVVQDALPHAVLIIGSDSPTLTPEHLEQAAQALHHHDVVVGPSFDGGYYLIGLRSPKFTQVFEGITWSTPKVLGETLARCQTHGLDVKLLDFWYDVDTLPDLELLRTHLCDYLVASPAGQHYSEVVEQLNALETSPSS